MSLTAQCTGISASDFAAGMTKQVPQIQLRNLKFNAKRMPYSSVIGGGRFDNNQGDTYRTSIPQRIGTGYSEVTPAFVPLLDNCGPDTKTANFGFTEFTAQLGSIAGRGPLICINRSRFTVAGQLRAGEQQLRDAIRRMLETDARYNLYVLSGVKVVVRDGLPLTSMITGGEFESSVAPLAVLPNASLTMGTLRAIVNYVSENFNTDCYNQGQLTQHMKFISGIGQNQALRDEAKIGEILRSIAAGSFKVGVEQLTSYEFTLTHQGVALGVDEKPLRYSALSNGTATTVDGVTIPAGYPVFLEPELTVAVTSGTALRVNPAWASALYEVGFLVGPTPIERLVPPSYLGEGAAKWPAQLVQGDLKWTIPPSIPCNEFEEFGRFIWRVVRAWNPVKPHNVVAIHYQRCNADLGLVTCARFS